MNCYNQVMHDKQNVKLRRINALPIVYALVSRGVPFIDDTYTASSVCDV